jgi:dynactin complex subunit
VDRRTREELIAENALLKEKLAALEAEIEMLRDKLSGSGNGSSATPFVKPSRQQRREAERQER